MLKIKKNTVLKFILNKDFTVELVEEIPEDRVCILMRTMTNLEVTEYISKISVYDMPKLIKKLEDLNVEECTEEDVEKLYEQITHATFKMKKISSEFGKRLLVDIKNTSSKLDEIHINFVDKIVDKVFMESCYLSKEDALFFG